MIKRTLYFGSPAYLHTENRQLVVSRPAEAQRRTVPIEDIGVVILDNSRITITQTLISRLLDNNVALITCDSSHHPTGLMLCLDGHTLQSQRFRAQVAAALPLRKKLWQQTIRAKIRNQAAVLSHHHPDAALYLESMIATVKSGDAGNAEARAAAYYWPLVFPMFPGFMRGRIGEPPNAALNYGYAILRAMVSRALVGSGLMPTLGIFHRNQYNAYCLADDIMEPYRPYVDVLVLSLLEEGYDLAELSGEVKKRLLEVPALDVSIGQVISPLMNAVSRTTASLARCFEGEEKKLLYPLMVP